MVRCASVLGVFALATLATGCAETLARNTTRGAMSAVKQSGKSSAMVEEATRAGTTGALGALTADERRQELTELSHDVANAAAAGVRTALGEALGASGRPAADVIAQLGQAAIFPECAHAADRTACIHSAIRGLTRTTTNELVRAIREQLGLPALVVAFVAGVLSTLFVVFVVVTLRMRRQIPMRTAVRPA